MKLALLSIGSEKESWYQEARGEYAKKISHFLSFEEIRLKPKSKERGQAAEKRELESAALLKSLSEKDYVILLDEKGKTFASKDFSHQLTKSLEKGKARVVFVLGGAFGASEELKKRADETWSLSSMTMNHLVAHVVLLEQIYRALTIVRGISYHNE